MTCSILLTGPALLEAKRTSAYILAPLARACSSSSRMSTPAPSPITKPSRPASNGRDAVAGASL